MLNLLNKRLWVLPSFEIKRAELSGFKKGFVFF
jgi:hypothetical protein